jgi:predicted phosphodiesterase
VTGILVLSDTHSQSSNALCPQGYIPSRVLKLADNADRAYHADDFDSRDDYLEVKRLFGKRLFAVIGNNDRTSPDNWPMSEGPKEEDIDPVLNGKGKFPIGLIQGKQFDASSSKISIESAMAEAR